jgi:hypothetical protein
MSDQMINLSWRFADVEKLEHWGVLPNILMTAWIRYNYDSISVPWNFSGVFQQIISYTRSDFFSLALMSLFFPLIYVIQAYRKKQLSQLTAGDIFNFSLAIASVVLLIFMGIHSSFAILNHPASLLGMRHNQFLYLIIVTTVLCIGLHQYAEFINAKQKIQPDDTGLSDIRRKVLVNLILITIVFAILGSIFGHSQVGSFLRFSSFFTPLIILICALSWGWLSGIATGSRFVSNILTKTVPIILIAGVLMSWSHWPTNASNWTAAPVKFLRGKLSLAGAYSDQLLGFPFGGIHPGTWEAVQHVPLGSRVWSTTVVSYCMAPGCQVESVISFKFSSRMNEILNGSPLAAKNILQQEGLNYFLFLSEYPLLDYLPFSELFKPENMKKYFTVKWTDGKTYLLTWKSSTDKAVSDEFLKAYASRLGEKEPESFKFSQSLGHLNTFMTMINNQQHPLHTVNFPWKNTSNI